jgi:hypothetical protein
MCCFVRSVVVRLFFSLCFLSLPPPQKSLHFKTALVGARILISIIRKKPQQ